MADILLFLFITIFFIYKLKNSFGKRTDDDLKREKSIEEFFKQKYQANVETIDSTNVIDITNKIYQENKIKLDLDFDVPNNVKVKLKAINFDQDNFLKGVESAVEMINEAFSNKDIDTLKNLLSSDIFNSFEKKIDDLTSHGKVLKSSLISIQSKKIDNITAKDNKILIDVLLEMEQINFIENMKKQVVMGDKKRIDIVKEKWTFERNIKSKTNFWIVNNISSLE